MQDQGVQMKQHNIKESNMIKLESACLDAMAINKEEQTLDLRFNSGGTYRYYDVPDNLGDELLGAESQGKFFHVNIRDKYTCKKLMSEEESAAKVAELLNNDGIANDLNLLGEHA